MFLPIIFDDLANLIIFPNLNQAFKTDNTNVTPFLSHVALSVTLQHFVKTLFKQVNKYTRYWTQIEIFFH